MSCIGEDNGWNCFDYMCDNCQSDWNADQVDRQRLHEMQELLRDITAYPREVHVGRLMYELSRVSPEWLDRVRKLVWEETTMKESKP